MTISYTGPVLALCQLKDGSVLGGSGPYLTKHCVTGESKTERVWHNSSIIHGIRLFGDEVVVFGGRNISSRHRHIRTRDWILNVAVVTNRIYAVTLHNRVEVYDLSTLGLIKTVSGPVHAILYSAEIFASGEKIEIMGGGVMSRVFVWSLGKDSFSVNTDHYQDSHHRGSVFKIRSNQDGTEVLTTSDDRTVTLWTRRSASNRFEATRSFVGHKARVWDAVFVDNDKIASACEDHHIRIFNRSTGDSELLQGHSKDVRALSFAGGMLVSGGEDESVRTWDMRAGTKTTEWRLPQSDDWIRGVHLSNSAEEIVVVVTTMGKIFKARVSRGYDWVLDINQQLKGQQVTCSALSGARLVVGSVGGHVAVIDVTTGRIIAVSETCVVMRAVSVFSLSHSRIVAANHCGDVVVLTVSEGLITEVSRITLKASKLLCCSSNETQLFFGDDKGYIHIVSAEGGRTIFVSKGDKIVAIGPNGIASTDTGKTFKINLSENSDICISPIETHFPANYLLTPGETVQAGFFATEFMIFEDETVVWRIDCGGHRRPFDFDTSRFILVHADQHAFFLSRGQGRCRKLAAGTGGGLLHGVEMVDSNTAVVVCEDNEVRFVDPKNLKIKHVARVHDGSVRAVAVGSGKVITGGSRSQITAFRLADGMTLKRTLPSVLGDNDVRVMGLAVSDACIGIADSTGRICIWREDDDSITATEAVAQISQAVALSITSCGDLFYVGASNGIVTCINKDGACLRTARFHQSGVNALRVIEERFLVSVGDDQALVVSDISDDSMTRIVSRIDDASVCSIRAIASRGNIVATTGTDRRVAIWAIDAGSGHISLVKTMATAVTDPLGVTFSTDEEILVVGRGMERLAIH